MSEFIAVVVVLAGVVIKIYLWVYQKYDKPVYGRSQLVEDMLPAARELNRIQERKLEIYEAERRVFDAEHRAIMNPPKRFRGLR